MDRQIYWDIEKNQFYYISNETDTGFPIKVYIPEDPRIKILEQKVSLLERIVMELDR